MWHTKFQRQRRSRRAALDLDLAIFFCRRTWFFRQGLWTCGPLGTQILWLFLFKLKSRGGNTRARAHPCGTDMTSAPASACPPHSWRAWPYAWLHRRAAQLQLCMCQLQQHWQLRIAHPRPCCPCSTRGRESWLGTSAPRLRSGGASTPPPFHAGLALLQTAADHPTVAPTRRRGLAGRSRRCVLLSDRAHRRALAGRAPPP